MGGATPGSRCGASHQLDEVQHANILGSELVLSMSCQAVVQPGSDGLFIVPGVAKPIPQMPEGTCLASSTELANRFTELGFQEGILVMSIAGEPKASVRHAWNVGPNGEIVDTTNRPMVWFGQDVDYTYIPDDAKHAAERQSLEQVIGPPADYDDDPEAQQESDELVAGWLEELGQPGT